MRKTISFLLVAFCLTATAQNSATSARQSEIYITHVTVIDTDTGKEATDQIVVISDGKISNVVHSKNLAVPASARIVDGRGKYLIPGLWDMHVHRTEYESTYPIYLANGVTGVRDMAGPFDADKFRADLAAKNIDSPRLLLASPIIDGYPPRFEDQIAVKNAEEARKVVAEQKRAGAVFIKVYDRLSRESYFAIMDEARRQHVPVVGHVPFAISAWEASAVGQMSIEHVHAVPLACSSHEAELRSRLVASPYSWKLWNAIYMEAYQTYDESKCQRLVAEFRRNGTWLVPTLVVFRSAVFSNDPQYRNDDRLRYFSGQMRTWLEKHFVSDRSNFDAADFAVERELLNRRKWLVGKLFRAGVPMLAGTDTPNPFCFPGFGLHDELALMVDSGVTPLGALQAATLNPALFLDATDKYGSVAPGKIADLVLLDADPLKDIHNTTKISEVFLNGREYDRAALDQILKNAEKGANASLKLSPAEGQTNPFVGTWKLVAERSHFDRTAPKDIKLQFQIDKDELTEQEEITLSNGTTRTTTFVPQYDDQEHPLPMSGETRHKSHAVLWTRVDDRTIERRINHDNGLEYTTERLSVSSDGQTLTETHLGKRPDGSPYETVITFQRKGPNASPSLSPEEQEVWDQEQTYWRSLKADDREAYLKLWDERFIGWPKYEGVPADKQRIRQELATAPNSRGRLVNYELQPLSVRAHGNDLVITFYRATVSRAKPDREVETRTSRLTHTWMKTDEGWRIIGGMSADDNQAADPIRGTIRGANLGESTSVDDTVQVLVSIDDARRVAMLHGDITRLGSLLADDAVILWGDGTIDGKSSTLALFRSGRLHYTRLDYNNTSVRVYGDVAVTTGDARLEGQSDEYSFQQHANVTRVYTRKQEHWRLVLSQTTRIPIENLAKAPVQGTPREATMHDTPTDSAEAELRAVMAELRKASIEGDMETAANSMADDYVQTDINGYRQDKTTWLNEYFRPLADLIKAGKFRWDEYERKNLQFRFYGDCAVVTGDLQAKGTGARFGPQHTWVPDPNASFSGTLHFTHVYIKRNGKWLLAALHNQMPLPPAT